MHYANLRFTDYWICNQLSFLLPTTQLIIAIYLLIESIRLFWVYNWDVLCVLENLWPVG